MALLLREDQAIIHAGVTGVNFPPVYSWTSLEGGDVDAEDVKTRPGGGIPAVNLGGPATRSDATVKRQYSDALHQFIVALENRCGHGAAWVSYTMLDGDNNPTGQTVTMTGILKGVQKPNLDANASGAAFLGLVIGLNQEASIS